MPFELPDLPYSHDALADSGMSKETMEFHHCLHHKAYVDNGNKLISGTEWEGKSLEDIVTGTYDSGAVAQNGIFNNASQHWNHMQFWQMMGPGSNSMPSELQSRITDSFGSIDEFKAQFCAAGVAQFGSGWCWLVETSDGSVKVTKTENGVNRSVSVRRLCWAAMSGNTRITSISATNGQSIWQIFWTSL